MRKFDTVIVGAGLSGLTIGYKLKKAGQRVLVLEASKRAGGALCSERKEGFLLEHGPNTVLAKPHLLSLIEELNLRDQLVLAPKNSARFIQSRHRLHKIPPGPLSLKGFFRALKEPWVHTAPLEQESVWDFFGRRFGTEVADQLVAPFVSGIWAGDAKTLSMKSAFPRLVELEATFGSVIKGLIRSPKKTEKPRIKGLISFQNGIQTLTDTLEAALSEEIQYETTVHDISKSPWTLQTSKEELSTDRVVFTSPSWSSAPLFEKIAPETSAALKAIPYAPIKVVHLGLNRADVKHSLNGFGYLVAPSEKKNILGCLWSSSLFPDRAPKQKVLLTIFMGGMTNPNVLKQDDAELVRLALEDITPILGLSNTPVFQSVTTYTKAIPQYTKGHDARVQTLKKAEKENPGLYFSGNILSGISVGDVIQQALETASQLQKSVRA